MRFLLTSLVCLILACRPVAANDTARLAYIVSIEEFEHPAQPVTRASGADVMADALARFGFTIQRYDNLKKWALEAALKEIYTDSKGAEAAIVYVSSFALQKGGRNVLLPADAAAAGLKHILSRAVEVEDIIHAPRARQLNLIVIDTPEDAPAAFGIEEKDQYSAFLEPREPSVPNRLAVYTSSAPSGIYSRLAPMTSGLMFARNFKQFLERGDRATAEVLRKTSVSVFYESRNVQFPKVVGALDTPYILSRKNEVSDITAWLKLQRKPKAEDFREFMSKFPGSIYIPFAQQRLQELEQQ